MKEKYLKELKKLDNKISNLYSKRNTIKNEFQQYRISTGDYIAGDELINTKITSDNIDVVLDSNFEEVYIPLNEEVYIQDGRLYCSSYSEGLLNYSDKDNCYIYSYHYNKQKLDIKYILLTD